PGDQDGVDVLGAHGVDRRVDQHLDEPGDAVAGEADVVEGRDGPAVVLGGGRGGGGGGGGLARGGGGGPVRGGGARGVGGAAAPGQVDGEDAIVGVVGAGGDDRVGAAAGRAAQELDRAARPSDVRDAQEAAQVALRVAQEGAERAVGVARDRQEERQLVVQGR